MVKGDQVVTFTRASVDSITVTDIAGEERTDYWWHAVERRAALRKLGFKPVYDKPEKDTSLPNCALVTFKVGDGCHWGFNGDAYPGTVRKVSKSGRKVWVSRDDYRVIDDKDGYTESDRDCVFTTLDLPESSWEEYHLTVHGHFVSGRGSGGAAWSLQPNRRYSRNPHF